MRIRQEATSEEIEGGAGREARNVEEGGAWCGIRTRRTMLATPPTCSSLGGELASPPNGTRWTGLGWAGPGRAGPRGESAQTDLEILRPLT